MKIGRILKLKRGYNPNSSSIGSQVEIFIKGLAISVLLLNLAAAIVSTIRNKKDKPDD